MLACEGVVPVQGVGKFPVVIMVIVHIAREGLEGSRCADHLVTAEAETLILSVGIFMTGVEVIVAEG